MFFECKARGERIEIRDRIATPQLENRSTPLKHLRALRALFEYNDQKPNLTNLEFRTLAFLSTESSVFVHGNIQPPHQNIGRHPTPSISHPGPAHWGSAPPPTPAPEAPGNQGWKSDFLAINQRGSILSQELNPPPLRESEPFRLPQ